MLSLNWFMDFIGIGAVHEWRVNAIKSLDSWEFQGFPSEAADAKNRIIAAIKREVIRPYELDLFALNQSRPPPVIWQLTNMVRLNLALNCLEAIPSEIGSLANLTELMLYNNRLKSLPSEIGLLTRLTDLRVHANKLTSLPTEIGKLIHLKKLLICNNKLRAIPAEIGLCRSLDTIKVNENRLLDELPMSFGQIPGLTELEIHTTRISVELCDSILNQCKALRREAVEETLPKRLHTWKTMAGVDLDSEGLIHSDINEWLVRLEKTRDYSRSQARLAGIVCRMLNSVRENEAFRELFFVQIAANNTCCEDRAAMALNEIYTSWKILCLPENTPLREKLMIMTRAAKTVALRAELAKCIPAHENESVEIYLYYETLFKEHLCTAIENMAYSCIGRREWIDTEQLMQSVNETYFAHLMNLPVFEKLARKELCKEWESLEQKAQNELAELGERPKGDEFSDALLAWEHNQGKVMHDLQSAWFECVKKWYSKV